MPSSHGPEALGADSKELDKDQHRPSSFWNRLRSYHFLSEERRSGVKVQVEQIDGRRLVIRARGNEVVVDDTLETGGPGDGFRPTELLLGALGACMIGTMINFARRQDITVADIAMQLEDDTADKPTRVERIRATMSLATDAGERRRDSLRRAAGGCKIHNTLDASPTVEFEFQVQ